MAWSTSEMGQSAARLLVAMVEGKTRPREQHIIVEPELVKYGAYGTRLLTVKPGLGGLWQVSGRSDTTYPERVAMDMSYIETRSLFLDLRLIIRTALVVIRGRGAY